MNPLVEKLARVEACDAVIAEVTDDDQLAAAVCLYLLGQLAYGVDPHTAVCSALRWIQRGRQDPPHGR